VSDDPGDLARACLAEHYVLALGTCGPEGPWVASVYFATDLRGDRLHLYFLSSPSSRHGQNLQSNPAAAGAINADEHDWHLIRGVQLEGFCQRVDGMREALRGWRVYLTRFPMVRGLFRGVPTDAPRLAGKLGRTRMYWFRVERAFYLDNRRGFGERTDVTHLL
jgi:uncharacterized protein